MSKQTMIRLWGQQSYFLQQALEQLSAQNITNRLTEDTSSAGFWLQHVAESKYILLHYFLGKDLPAGLVTVNGATDEGQVTDLSYILRINEEADADVLSAINTFSDEELLETKETFLGPMSRAEMFGVMSYHTYYHVGQASLAIKRGAPIGNNALAMM